MFESVSIWGIIWRSRTRNTKATGQTWLEFEFIVYFMPVLVTYKAVRIFFSAKGHVTPK